MDYEKSTVREFRTVQEEGSCVVARILTYYKLKKNPPDILSLP